MEGAKIKGYFRRIESFLIFFTLITSFWLIVVPKAGADLSTLSIDHSANNFIEATAPIKELSRIIRKALCGHDLTFLPQKLPFTFQPEISQLYITLLQSGRKPLRWGARRHDLTKTLGRVIAKIRSLSRFAEFAVSEPDKCRILFEIVTSEKKGDITKLDSGTLSDNRFEPGITGFKYSFAGITR